MTLTAQSRQAGWSVGQRTVTNAISNVVVIADRLTRVRVLLERDQFLSADRRTVAVLVKEGANLGRACLGASVVLVSHVRVSFHRLVNLRMSLRQSAQPRR